MKKMCLALLILFVTSGCILVPAIDSFNKLGVAESDRQALLPQTLKKFQEQLYWGQRIEALKYAEEDSREAVAKALRPADEEQRIVESKIRGMDFTDNAYKAEVTIFTKFYKVPYYIVVQRIEKQSWRFSLSDGWKITAMEVEEKSA